MLGHQMQANQLTNFYDLSELQDLDQIRLDLNEENRRIRHQEERLRMMFGNIKLQNQKSREEKQKIKRVNSSIPGSSWRTPTCS
jgi:hypothetical protein